MCVCVCVYRYICNFIYIRYILNLGRDRGTIFHSRGTAYSECILEVDIVTASGSARTSAYIIRDFDTPFYTTPIPR